MDSYLSMYLLLKKWKYVRIHILPSPVAENLVDLSNLVKLLRYKNKPIFHMGAIGTLLSLEYCCHWNLVAIRTFLAIGAHFQAHFEPSLS